MLKKSKKTKREFPPMEHTRILTAEGWKRTMRRFYKEADAEKKKK